MKSGLSFLIASRRCEIQDLEQLLRTSALVNVIGRLVHALQKERGLVPQVHRNAYKPYFSRHSHHAGSAAPASMTRRTKRCLAGAVEGERALGKVFLKHGTVSAFALTRNSKPPAVCPQIPRFTGHGHLFLPCTRRVEMDAFFVLVLVCFFCLFKGAFMVFASPVQALPSRRDFSRKAGALGRAAAFTPLAKGAFLTSTPL